MLEQPFDTDEIKQDDKKAQEAVNKKTFEGCFTIEDDKLTVTEIRVPGATCPLIDSAIKRLEQIRTANEQLHSATYSYHNANRALMIAYNDIVKKNEELKKENDELSIFRVWAKGFLDPPVMVLPPAAKDRAKLVGLTAENSLLKKQINDQTKYFEVIADILKVADSLGWTARLTRNLPSNTRETLEIIERQLAYNNKKLRQEALRKLSKEERKVLDISVEEDEEVKDESPITEEVSMAMPEDDDDDDEDAPKKSEKFKKSKKSEDDED